MSVMVTARDVPEIRARLAGWARDPGLDGAGNWFRFFLGPSPARATESRVFSRADDVAAMIVGTLAAQFPVAELFYVSAEMTDLARHAAESLTDYRLHPEDLPAPVGVMVYEHPPVKNTASDRQDGITMVSWGPGRGGLWVHTWGRSAESWYRHMKRLGRALAQTPHEEVLARATRAATMPPPTAAEPPTTEEAIDWFLGGLVDNLRRASIPPSFTPVHGYDWLGLTPMEFTDMHGWPTRVRSGNRDRDSLTAATKVDVDRTILATWLLMGQTLVRSEPVTAPRPARRRIERLDPGLDPTVRYIDLRRARTESSERPGDSTDDSTDDSGSGTRDYRHRWIVRGHWRNQYYPSRDDHRPIWIDPHLAGPEDKPLLGGERVNVLRR
jgi:hypothetical protein